MQAICDTTTGEVLFCQLDAGAQPSGRVAVTLDAATATYATKGVPLLWDGENTVSVDLGHLKDELRARVKALRDSVETSGCTVAGIGKFETDDASKLKIVGAVVAATIEGASFSRDWRLSDNTIVTLSATQMVSVGLAVADQVNAAQARKNALDAEIVAASTLAELEAIDIETGWPS